MKRGLFFLVLLVIWGSEGRSENESALRLLLTGDDSRGWQAVGRLNIANRSFCTGSLIAPDLVLTAAHCLYDRDSGQRVADAEVEFLADLRGGRASAYRAVKRSVVHPDFVYGSDNYASRVASDLAVLQLDQPIRNSSIVPFATHGGPREGDAVGVVSYAHDRADSPSLQEVCHVLARQGGSLVLSCDVDFGSSGAPVFVLENGVPQIVSVVSAKADLNGSRVALGMSLEAPLPKLMAMLASGDGVFGSAEPVVRRLTLSENRNTIGAKFIRP